MGRRGVGFTKIGRLDRGDLRMNLGSNPKKVREGRKILPNGIGLTFMEDQELSCEGSRNNHPCNQPREPKEDVVLQVSLEY
jgi:hypothetical protein